MKRRTRSIRAFPALLALLAPGFGPAWSAAWAQDVGPAEDVEAIKETLTTMWAALERGDLEAYAEHVHPEFTSFGEGDVYLNSGKEYDLASLGDWLDRGARVHTEMKQPRVVVRDDTAWITYYWTDWGPVGEERYSSRGKSTRIFVKEDGRWLCIHGHYTAVP